MPQATDAEFKIPKGVPDLRRPNKVRKYIEDGGDLERTEVTWGGFTMLAEAARRGYGETTQMLLEANANVNAVNSAGESVLVSRCSITDDTHGDVASICSLLLKHGAEVNYSDANGLTSLTNVLMASGSQQVVALLLAHKADANHVISQPTLINVLERTEGLSPLATAARAGRVDLVIMLLHARADVELGSRSALHLACESGCIASLDVLLSRCPSAIARIDESGFTPLIVACRKANYEVAKMLLTRGAVVNALDLQGRSALLSIGLDAHEGASRVALADLLLLHGADAS